MRSHKDKIIEEIEQLVDAVQEYFLQRHQQESMEALSLTVRDLRIQIQQMLGEVFVPLTLSEAKEFRSILADKLFSLVGILKAPSHSGSIKHYQYCIDGILACFQCAEKIKEEIPDDFHTQKILIQDIPILRPFDYGTGHPSRKDHKAHK